MPRGLVIADDLTGANATGVLLKKNGFATYTVMNAACAGDSALADCECLVVSTDSRSISRDEAYDRVKFALQHVDKSGVSLYSKRIDSTLRGNLGSETDAFLDVLGDDYIAACVPCFPSSGRILVGGYLLVNGVLLSHTEVAADPKNPIHTSSAKELYLDQSKHKVATLHLNDIEAGSAHLMSVVKRAKADGARVVIFDAVFQEDIEAIAEALVAAEIKFVAVDPGVFTAAAAKRLIPVDLNKNGGKVFCAIGSVNGVARKQVGNLLNDLPVFNVFIEISEILEGGARQAAEIDRVARAILDNCENYAYCSAIGSGIDPDRVVPFDAFIERRGVSALELSEDINDSTAEITYRVLSGDKRFRALYTTGGDITAAVNRRIKSSGLRLLDEVVPLAGYGEIIGGAFDGLKFISKGGMVGDERAMTTCMRYLKDRI